MVKTPEPMTTLKAAPKWQKALDVKENSYHEYSDSNHYSQDRNSRNGDRSSYRNSRAYSSRTSNSSDTATYSTNTGVNNVWGEAKESHSTYRHEKQDKFTKRSGEFSHKTFRRDEDNSSFNERRTYDNGYSRGKSSYSKGKDSFSKGKPRAPSHKPRVFGPDGIKDL